MDFHSAASPGRGFKPASHQMFCVTTAAATSRAWEALKPHLHRQRACAPQKHNEIEQKLQLFLSSNAHTHSLCMEGLRPSTRTCCRISFKKQTEAISLASGLADEPGTSLSALTKPPTNCGNTNYRAPSVHSVNLFVTTRKLSTSWHTPGQLDESVKPRLWGGWMSGCCLSLTSSCGKEDRDKPQQRLLSPEWCPTGKSPLHGCVDCDCSTVFDSDCHQLLLQVAFARLSFPPSLLETAQTVPTSHRSTVVVDRSSSLCLQVDLNRVAQKQRDTLKWNAPPPAVSLSLCAPPPWVEQWWSISQSMYTWAHRKNIKFFPHFNQI